MAEQIEEQKLIQNKGSFVLKGIIEGKDNPANNNGYKEGAVEKGKCKGSLYRSIRFKVKTSNDNIIPVEIFGMEQAKVYFYNKKEKKTVNVDWDKRFLKPQSGYQLIVPSFDMIKEINENYKDGEAVLIVGEFQFSKYTNPKGDEILQTKYIIKRINHSTDLLDFDNEKFIESNEFNQEAVINDIEVDNENKKVYINAYIIGYKDSFNSTTFELDTSTANPMFVRTIKTLKFGDFLKFYGRIQYKVVNIEEDGAFGKQLIKNYKKCLEVIGADKDSFKQKMYKEEDFIIEDKTESPLNWGDVTKSNTVDLPFDLDG